MSRWTERPLEVANLLNPAFSAVITHECVRNYYRVAAGPLPISLLFLAPPIALHGPTRRGLPRTTVAKMRPWLDQNPQVRIGFARRARTLRGFTREGILFATHHKLVEFSAGGITPLRKTQLRLPGSWRPGSDAFECLKAAGFVARWFAATAGATTLYALWGVKP